MQQRSQLNNCHKAWCELIRGGPEAQCTCDGMPSPKQQLLARALDRLVTHSKETLLLMEAVKVCAQECVKEKEQDAAQEQRDGDAHP